MIFRNSHKNTGCTLKSLENLWMHAFNCSAKQECIQLKGFLHIKLPEIRVLKTQTNFIIPFLGENRTSTSKACSFLP